MQRFNTIYRAAQTIITTAFRLIIYLFKYLEMFFFSESFVICNNKIWLIWLNRKLLKIKFFSDFNQVVFTKPPLETMCPKKFFLIFCTIWKACLNLIQISRKFHELPNFRTLNVLSALMYPFYLTRINRNARSSKAKHFTVANFDIHFYFHSCNIVKPLKQKHCSFLLLIYSHLFSELIFTRYEIYSLHRRIDSN